MTLLPGLARLGKIMEEVERERKNGHKKLKKEIGNMKSIELDGIAIIGNTVEKDGLVEITIPVSEELKIKNSNASFHRLYGKQFEVSSIIFDHPLMRIFGSYTDKDTPRSHKRGGI